MTRATYNHLSRGLPARTTREDWFPIRRQPRWAEVYELSIAILAAHKALSLPPPSVVELERLVDFARQDYPRSLLLYNAVKES